MPQKKCLGLPFVIDNLAKTPFRNHSDSILLNQTIRLAQAQIVTYLVKGFFAFALTGSARSHSLGAKSQNQGLKLLGTSLKKVRSVRISSYYPNSHPKSTPYRREGCHRPAEAGEGCAD